MSLIYVQYPAPRLAVPKRLLNPTDIVCLVLDYFNLSLEEIRARNRKRHIVVPRMIAMWLIYRNTKLSYRETARVLGLGDHTTAMHSINTINDLIDTDSDIKNQVEYLSLKVSRL